MNHYTMRKVWLSCGSGFALYGLAVSLWRGEPVLGGLLGGGIAAGGLALIALAALLIAGALWLARHTQLGEVAAWKAGTLFGIAAYAAIYGVALQLAVGTVFPDPDKLRLALDLFPYIFLMGIPLFNAIRKRPPLS